MSQSSTPPLKVCTKCGAEKPRGDFYCDRKTHDGLFGYCKACNEAQKAAYREANREKVSAYSAVYRAKNRERIVAWRAAYHAANRERSAACSAAYAATHREEIAARMAVYRAENRERLLAQVAAYSVDHPEQRAANERNRKARKKGNGGTHTAEDIQAQYARQKGRCFWCKKKLGKKYHVDHVIPLVLGGSNGPENLVVACPTCNQSKGAKHPMDFDGRLL